MENGTERGWGIIEERCPRHALVQPPSRTAAIRTRFADISPKRPVDGELGADRASLARVLGGGDSISSRAIGCEKGGETGVELRPGSGKSLSIICIYAFRRLEAQYRSRFSLHPLHLRHPQLFPRHKSIHGHLPLRDVDVDIPMKLPQFPARTSPRPPSSNRRPCGSASQRRRRSARAGRCSLSRGAQDVGSTARYGIARCSRSTKWSVRSEGDSEMDVIGEVTTGRPDRFIPFEPERLMHPMHTRLTDPTTLPF